MDYRKSLNLPQTTFPMKANLVQREPEILKFWEENEILKMIRIKNKDREKFVLHDGPPYANGDVHLGTAFNKILKDIIVKYKLMQGYDSPFVPGWDCHGMPIEHRVVEELGEKINSMSQAEIRKHCKDYALHYVNVQREQFKRLGVMGDWESPYLTLSPKYEAKIIEVFGKLVEEGFVYKGLRPIHWCATCVTALAEAEVEYDEHSSPSIYVKFPLRDLILPHSELAVSMLIWTTTPWTLPANVAIAVHPDFEYQLIKVNKKEVWIIVKDLTSSLMEKLGIGDYQVIKTILGKELEGKVCQHPFIDREIKIILGDFVTKDVGTGGVHIAPGHGDEDYVVGLKYKLPILSPVDDKGNFTSEVKEFAGMNVFQANEKIVRKLEETGFLIHKEELVHSYPHCWRCHQPIIFRATEQWFFNLDQNNLRKRALKAIRKVRWHPGWGEEKIYHLVATRPDWCLSRQRSWGVPIPAFYCENCNHLLLNAEVIEHLKGMVEKEGVDFWFEKPAEDILPSGIKCPNCSKELFRKETNILDVWFESGVSYSAVLEQDADLSLPADIYLEATDQHRGWFQSSLWPSMVTHDTLPYKMVITHGLILDEQGKKMSKSLGNVIAPEDIVEKYGADILRLWLSSVDYTSDIRISAKSLDPIVEAYRKIRNTVRFLLGNLYDYNTSFAVPYEQLHQIDKWALMKLNRLIKKVTESFDNFEFHSAYYAIYNFCVVEMSSFYLDVLKDRLYVSGANSLARRSAQTVLNEILISLVKLLAPFLTFTAEEVWQNIKDKEEKSVYLAGWPKENKKYEDKMLEERWERLLEFRGEIFRALEIARNQKLIGHSYEAKVIVYTNSEGESFLNSFGEELKDILIVSQIEIKSLNEDIPEEAMRADKIEDLQILIQKAEGRKCLRCWNYSKEVGKEEKYPEICPRCVKVLSER